jgi:hypothetical protein
MEITAPPHKHTAALKFECGLKHDIALYTAHLIEFSEFSHKRLDAMQRYFARSLTRSDAFDFRSFMHFKSVPSYAARENIHISNPHACCIRKLPPLDSTWYRATSSRSLSLSL